MKKYLGITHLILYPYINLLLSSDTLGSIGDGILITVFFVALAAFQIAVIATGIIAIVKATKGKLDSADAARLNLAVKCFHIPAYVFNFFVGSFSFILGHFGFVTLGFAFVADVFAIVMSGLFAVSCAVAFRKEEKQTTLLSIITGVLSFTFCVDVGTAIYYFFKANKTTKIINTNFQGDEL